MFEFSGVGLDTEIAYRRERLSDAAAGGAWKRSGGRWSRRSRTAPVRKQPGGRN